MKSFWFSLILLWIVNISSCNKTIQFPDGFLFGAASSAYQIEGGWDTDGKGESIWDHIVHTRPELVHNSDTGDIACDSYHKYKEDVQLLKMLGVKYYRFSISWPRILPTGFTDLINEKGIAYYNNLIDELLKNDIIPYVTLYHWDLPQKLQDLGGWTNRYLIDIFVDYARIAFKTYGDRVKVWQTFNEILQICYDGYGLGFAPMLNMSGVADYLCVHTTLLAHAKTYHVYDEEFRESQKGRIGMSISSHWYFPATNNSEDIEAAHINQLFETALIADPIFSKNGDYPIKLKRIIAEKSEQQSFKRSRLPSFTPEEIEYVKGTADFYGLNHYTSYLTAKAKEGIVFQKPSLLDDQGSVTSKDSEWEYGSSSWLTVVPSGLRSLLNFIKNRYENPEMLIFENGFSDWGELNDLKRIEYYRLYLEAVREAIDDGCNVTHYTAWSLMDSLEWFKGYSEKFGLFHVDFNHPNRTRTAKASALVYKEIIRTNTIDWNYNPTVNSSEGIYILNSFVLILFVNIVINILKR